MTRPVFSATQAAAFTMAEVLKYAGPAGAERIDPWRPDLAPIDQGALAFDLRVDPAQGQFRTIQAAVDEAVRQDSSGTGPVRIAIAAGHYDELVYVPATARPIALYGLGATPHQTVVRANIDAGMSGAAYSARFAGQFARSPDSVRRIFAEIAARDSLGTINAAVMRVYGDGFVAHNLTVENSYNEDRISANESATPPAVNARGQFARGQHQAVAVIVAGADKVRFERLRLLGDQDTLYLKTDLPVRSVRSYWRDCYIEGDIDFIFGGGTAFFDRCEICSKGARTEMAFVTAPSTHLLTPYGFVFDSCKFTHDGSENALKSVFSLGRQWFEGARCTPYGDSKIEGYRCDFGPVSQFTAPKGTISAQTLFSVGKVAILNSRIGAHIAPEAPWFAWNGGRHMPDGRYDPADWAPRFRPVHYTARDFIANLAHWAQDQGVDLGVLRDSRAAQIPFVGEFGNRDV
ncbi:Pectinesterase B precursor [Aquimixticola soesokkakensis]|uniref:Pectinesterase n=1 Tax=Aquimixticola soesokkakensis TaxID=1519096 RepID=A0A1Y5RRF8_9RHOB|nr:pectinesterase family protein [Aquimixticola soesokkakensis]SLN23699.1 Pectinesterase B precursor [Aquimixticola soesokkakensis]